MKVLAYVEMKVQRAKTHLENLNGELDHFLLNEACTVTDKVDVRNGLYIRRTTYNTMPPGMGMLLGECLYCLRSGLDQLAWQLALDSARSDIKLSKNVCFPVFESVSTGDHQRALKSVLALFPAPIAREIDAIQPYKRSNPQESPLWKLNRLCNIDKHCIIPFGGRVKYIFIPYTQPEAIVQVLEAEDAIEVSVPIDQKDKFDLDPHDPMDVELGEWETDLAFPRSTLAEVHNFITDELLPRFARFDGEILFKDRFRRGAIKEVLS